MKFLIAGLGSIGRRHLRNLVRVGETDILLYRTHQSTLPDEELEPFPAYADLAAALAQKPDAVFVCNPTALHLDVAIPAAKAGCHLFLEKPISDALDGRVAILKQALRESGSKVLVGFQFRFHPVLSKIRAKITQGEIGRLFSFRVHWGEYLPDWHPWEDYRQSYAARKDLGGGVVNTLSHPLDYIRWIFGEVSSLSALTAQVSNLELSTEDLAEITLQMSSGCVGSLHLDYFQRPPAHWIEINAEGGHVRWKNETGIAEIYQSDRELWEKLAPPKGFERNDLFIAELKHFIKLIQGETDSRCDLQDGIRVLELTEAVHSSAQQKRHVVLG